MSGEARRARRLAQRSVSKENNRFNRQMRDARRDLLADYGIDFEQMRKEAAQARRELDMCLHDDDLRIFASKEEAAKIDDELLSCELCGKKKLRVLLVASPWLRVIDGCSPEAREAFMSGLLK